ncbi:hypothetical protein [Sphaerisporangium perillae]|uniref:hypothetical protein n=1 Tax=Sphaerisporangium perillae TaxID=2935860 RepID=UPI00200E4ABB|nr:hypothetical protein [Sphaerisporangium perillae]
MSLTDIVRTIAKNVRQTVSDPKELKEKAKDLPLNVLQTALTGVGQALMLTDRIRTGIKRLVTDEDKAAYEPPAPAATAAPQVAKEEREEKPARREPVIFAPRPSAPVEGQNGAAPKAEPAATAPPAPPVKPAPAEAKPVATEPAKPATRTAEPAKPAAEPAKPATAEPAAATAQPAAETETAAEIAEPVKPATRAPRSRTSTATPKAKAAPAAAKAEKAAPKPRTRKPKAEEGKLADAAVAGTVAPSEAAVSSPAGTTSTLAEPMPGYSELTMASLRARLRGKSADQIRSLLEYERKTTARDDIVQMYAKRLAKLEEAG